MPCLRVFDPSFSVVQCWSSHWAIPRGREAKKGPRRFTVGFYGARIFCRKTAQCSETPRQCALLPVASRKTSCATSRKAAQKLVRQLEIRCSIRLSYGRRRSESNRASAGCNLRSEMPRSIGRVGQTGSGSDGRVARKTWCYSRKSAEAFFGGRNDRRDISRGSRFSIPRPLTRPGGGFWFVKACRRPAALLHHLPSGGPLDGVLGSSPGSWGEDAQPPRSSRGVRSDATVS